MPWRGFFLPSARHKKYNQVSGTDNRRRLLQTGEQEVQEDLKSLLLA